MTASFKSSLGVCVASALLAVGTLPSEKAQARTEEPWYRIPTAEPAHLLAETSPRAGRWSVQADRQLASVAAQNGEVGIFTGVQCDPYDPAARRLLLGVRKGVDAPAMRILLRGGMRKIRITASDQGITSTFEAAPEDRGQTSFAGNSDYVATYLSRTQLEAIASAKTLFVQVGEKTYNFTGYGSSRALGSMTCSARPVHIASRMIEGQRGPTTAKPKQTWRVSYHSGTAALLKGTVDASVSSTPWFVDSGTTFKLGVACLGNRIYARVGADLRTQVRDDETLEKSAKFIGNFSTSAKQIEIYRDGQRISALAISKAEMVGRGRPLSSLDIANIMEADELVVVSQSNSIAFPASGSSAALDKVLQTCPIAPAR